MQTYEKANVLSTNLVGGDSYHLSPRLIEYCVQLVSSLPLLVNAQFSEARLSSKVHTNKLAVCLGDGSQYAKHYDNSAFPACDTNYMVYLFHYIKVQMRK